MGTGMVEVGREVAEDPWEVVILCDREPVDIRPVDSPRRIGHWDERAVHHYSSRPKPLRPVRFIPHGIQCLQAAALTDYIVSLVLGRARGPD